MLVYASVVLMCSIENATSGFQVCNRASKQVRVTQKLSGSPLTRWSANQPSLPAERRGSPATAVSDVLAGVRAGFHLSLVFALEFSAKQITKRMSQYAQPRMQVMLRPATQGVCMNISGNNRICRIRLLIQNAIRASEWMPLNNFYKLLWPVQE